MLVLSRKCGEEVIIDGEIRVRILRCSNGRVRLGVDAPDHVRVLRTEVLLDEKSAQPRSV